MIQHIQFLSES